MEDNVKAVFTFGEGTVQIEGPQAFVSEWAAKFPSEGGKAEAARHLVEEGIDHAWQWFSLHATHRMRAVYFFLIASAFLSTAYVGAIHSYPRVAIAVGVVGVLFSVCFYMFEVRIRELLHAAEDALVPAQQALAEATDEPAFKICDRVKTPEHPRTAYSTVIRTLLLVTSIGFLCGIINGAYVSLESPVALSLRDDLLLLVIYRSVVVLGAIAFVYWAQKLVARDRATRSLAQYLTALALAGTGIFALLVSAIRPLR